MTVGEGKIVNDGCLQLEVLFPWIARNVLQIYKTLAYIGFKKQI